MAVAPINRRIKLARGETELIERLSRSDRLVYSPHLLAELFRAMRERLSIAATLRPSAYFSHSTAAYLNSLTDTLPNYIR